MGIASLPVMPWLCAIWALGVAWSRAGLGKHQPVDCGAGLLCGVLATEIANAISLQAWCVAKLFAGSVTCAEVSYMLARPESRLEGFKIHFLFQLIWWASQPFGLGLQLSGSAILGLALPNVVAFATMGRLQTPA